MAPISIKKPSAPVVDPITQRRTEGLTSTNTGVVVATAGEVMRRQASSGKAVVEQAQAAIGRLSQADIRAAVQQISVSACRAECARAAEEAFEAAFADGPEERGEFARSALEALLSRDRIESTLFVAKSRGVADTDLREGLGGLDHELGRSLGRSLTGINAERRAALAELDPSEREGAVWFSSFVDADDLLPALAGAKTDDLSGAAREALAASALPVRGSDESTASALARVAMKTASSEERALLDARAKRSSDLARDIAEAERPYELEAATES